MATYEELKKKRGAAEKAQSRAFKTLSDTADEFKALVTERNAKAVDGFYVEADRKWWSSDFPIYIKTGNTWLWNGNGSAFTEPDWIDDDGFDIEVIPISEVKF